MDAIGMRFWKTTALWTVALFLFLLLYSVYGILAAPTRMPMSERFGDLLFNLPGAGLALALPVSAFAAGFGAAPAVFSDREGIRRRLGTITLSGVLLALLCLLILGYLEPLLQQLGGEDSGFSLYLHQLPGARAEALSQASMRRIADPMRWHDAGRFGWNLYFRFFWSLLVAVAVGIGLLSGYWARWTPSRRLVALQAWMVALVLTVSVAVGLVLGLELAERTGAAVLGAWMLLRAPLVVLLALAWPTWLALRHPRPATHQPSGGATG